MVVLKRCTCSIRCRSILQNGLVINDIGLVKSVTVLIFKFTRFFLKLHSDDKACEGDDDKVCLKGVFDLIYKYLRPLASTYLTIRRGIFVIYCLMAIMQRVLYYYISI